MKKQTTFYIVRHGQTNWNVAGIMQGQTDTHLTPHGENQLRQTRDKLQNVSIDAIFASDLERTVKSAEIVRGERPLPIVTSKLLRERSYGQYEGKSIKEYRDVEIILEQLEGKDRFLHKIEGIESDKELMERFQEFLQSLVKKFEGKTVLIVSHGAVIQTFLIMIGYVTYATLPEKLVTNGSYVKIATDGKQFTVEEVWGITKKL